VAPGVESWTDYSNKAAVGRASGDEKVDRVAAHFEQLAEHIPYLQANFMFGLDSDTGDEPVDLTRRFMDRTPFAWPTINIPVPFGGTPLHDELAADGRVLSAMPFSFYYAPYLVSTLKNYDPLTYYEKLTELYAHAASPAMLRRRLDSTRRRSVRWIHRARTSAFRADIASFREILDRLRTDRQFRLFHEGGTTTLPAYYRRLGDRMLGRYSELLTPAERTPDLAQASRPQRRAPDLAQPSRPPRRAPGAV